MGSRFLNVVVKGDSMWPTLSDGSIVRFQNIMPNEVKVGQIILTKHPLKSNLMIIKRVQSISKENVFLIGDNPDPNASEDIHNIASIKLSEIVAKNIKE